MLEVGLAYWDTTKNKHIHEIYNEGKYSLYLFKEPTKIILNKKEILVASHSIFMSKQDVSHHFCISDANCRFDFIEIVGDETCEIVEKLKLPVNTLFCVHSSLYVSNLIKEIAATKIQECNDSKIKMDITLRQLLLNIGLMYWNISSNTPSMRDKYVQMMKSIRNEMVAHPEYDWSVPVMAKKINMCESSFRKLYVKYHNVSPKDDLINIRIQKAKQLMHLGELSVKEVANAVGYDNEYYFMRLFKRKTGFPPGSMHTKINEKCDEK